MLKENDKNFSESYGRDLGELLFERAAIRDSIPTITTQIADREV